MRKIIYILSVSLFSLACTKDLDIVVDDGEPRLVIEANCPYANQTSVRLSRTLPYNSLGDFENISNAQVTIKHVESGRVAILEESPVESYKGFYSTRDFVGTEGGNYQLRVEVDGKVYTAQSTRFPAVEIDSIKLEKELIATSPKPYYAITTYITDPVEVENYYKVTITVPRFSRSITFIANDRYFNGKVYGLTYRYSGMLEKGETIIVELSSITKEIHQYYFELMQLSDQMTDISQNPQSNIVGGALGYFSAYSTYQSWIEVD